MSIIDDLKMYNDFIKITRPKNYVDIVLCTECPIVSNDSIGVEYKEKRYLIASQMFIERVRREARLSIIDTFMPPVIENEKLVREILSYIHMQPDNEFEMSDIAKEWVFENTIT